MNRLTTVIATLWILTFVSCANKDTVYRSVYDGLQKREQILNPAPEEAQTESGTSFDAYRREREKILNKPK